MAEGLTESNHLLHAHRQNRMQHPIQLPRHRLPLTPHSQPHTSQNLPGGPSGVVPPVPIPNTAVKGPSANDTRGATLRENRSPPGRFSCSRQFEAQAPPVLYFSSGKMQRSVAKHARLRHVPPSSRGLGHRPFKAKTGIRIPLGVPPYVSQGSESPEAGAPRGFPMRLVSPEKGPMR